MDPRYGRSSNRSTNGVDFRIIKHQKVVMLIIPTSTWSRKSRALTEEENKAIELKWSIPLQMVSFKNPPK